MSNKNSISYRRVGDYNIPNLILPPEEAHIKLGTWGMLHKDYLLKHKKVLFVTLLTEGNLWQYLADIDTQAQQMYDSLVEQIKEKESITEQLKTENQIVWFTKMNSISNTATEIVKSELIYT